MLINGRNGTFISSCDSVEVSFIMSAILPLKLLLTFPSKTV